MSITTIRMHNLTMPVRLGVYDWEKIGPQDVTLHLDVRLSKKAADQAATSDDLAHTLDYARTELAVKELLQAKHYALLEHLCSEVAALLLAEDKVTAVRVEIVKKGALLHAPAVSMVHEANKSGENGI